MTEAADAPLLRATQGCTPEEPNCARVVIADFGAVEVTTAF